MLVLLENIQGSHRFAMRWLDLSPTFKWEWCGEREQIKMQARLISSPLKYEWFSSNCVNGSFDWNPLYLTPNSWLHCLNYILFCLTTSLSDKCWRQIESLHGNWMGSLNILEQYEHFNCDLSIVKLFIALCLMLWLF